MTAAATALNADRELAEGAVGITGKIGRLLSGLRELAPYAAVELILPGGSLVALLMWLYRRHKRMTNASGGELGDQRRAV
jgi:hypothetical protein